MGKYRFCLFVRFQKTKGIFNGVGIYQPPPTAIRGLGKLFFPLIGVAVAGGSRAKDFQNNP
jgi:hypothetical protein